MKARFYGFPGAWAVLLALACAPAANAAPGAGIQEPVLRSLKAATVFIRVSAFGGEGSGTGFLVHKSGRDGYIVTSEHVVRQDGRTAPDITVVFKSGAPGELSLKAALVGAHSACDIAILKVTSPSELPAPIGFSSQLKPLETMPVLVLGFPFGKALSLTEGNPSVTIGQGTISSLRNDAAGRLEVIQVDGDLNPGNSGGPVVTTEGVLVGVSAATVLGTQIGLTIPAARVANVIRGDLDSFSYEGVSGNKRKVELRVKIAFVDPLGRISKAVLSLTPREKVRQAARPNPQETTGWTQVDPAGSQHTFNVRNGAVTETVSVAPVEGVKGVYVAQVAFQRGAKEVIYGEPQEWDLGADAEFFAASGAAPAAPRGAEGGGWLGADTAPAGGGTEKTAPYEIVRTNRLLYTTAKVVADASVIPLNIASAEIAGDLLWSRDARHVYVLYKTGELREISVPDLVERRLLNVGAPCTDLALSAKGLLVACAGRQQLLVIGENDLRVLGAIDVGGAARVTSAPGASVAFVGEGREIVAVDLNTRKIIATFVSHEVNAKYGKRITRHPDGVVLSDFRMPRMSPDGRYLFCVGFECLHRLSLRGRELVYEEMGPRIGQNPRRIEFSDDSMYVALPSGGGNYNFTGMPQLTYATYVFSTLNLQKALLTVHSGSYPRSLAFDKVGQCIYTMNFDTQLITFSPVGQKVKEYVLTGRGDQTDQILVHPTGRKILLRCGSLHWVEIDGGARAQRIAGGSPAAAGNRSP